MLRFRSAAAALALALAVVPLASCDPDSPALDTTPTTEPSTESTVKPVETASAEPTAAPTPYVAPDCNQLVPQTRIDWLGGTTLALTPQDDFFAAKPGTGYDRFKEFGGVFCPYGNGTHYVYAFAWAPVTADQQGVIVAEYASDTEHVQSEFAGGILFTCLIEESPYHLIWFDNAGNWYLATDEQLLDELRRIPHPRP